MMKLTRLGKLALERWPAPLSLISLLYRSRVVSLGKLVLLRQKQPSLAIRLWSDAFRSTQVQYKKSTKVCSPKALQVLTHNLVVPLIILLEPSRSARSGALPLSKSIAVSSSITSPPIMSCSPLPQQYPGAAQQSRTLHRSASIAGRASIYSNSGKALTSDRAGLLSASHRVLPDSPPSLALLPPPPPSQKLILWIMQKNFNIRSHKRKNTNLSMEFPASPSPGLQEIEAKIALFWQSIEANSMQVSEQSVLRFLRKTMKKKCFTFAEVIFASLKKRKLIYPQNIDEYNISQLLYEMESLQSDVEDLIWRKFSRDIDIMEEKIKLEDERVRDSLTLAQYESITNSFRPSLISNPSNLSEEFLGIESHIGRTCSRLQQLRYQKLAHSSQSIAQMHNRVCQGKREIKMN